MEQNIKSAVEFYFKKILGYIPSHTIKLIDDDSKRWAGQATYNKNILEFNLAYHRRDQYYFMTEIIGHEVAHLCVAILYPDAKQHHGPEFRKIMKMMGLLGKTYVPVHMVTPVDKPYEYRCGCSDPLFLSLKTHNKVQKMRNPTCNKCRQISRLVSN